MFLWNVIRHPNTWRSWNVLCMCSEFLWPIFPSTCVFLLKLFLSVFICCFDFFRIIISTRKTIACFTCTSTLSWLNTYVSFSKIYRVLSNQINNHHAYNSLFSMNLWEVWNFSNNLRSSLPHTLQIFPSQGLWHF